MAASLDLLSVGVSEAVEWTWCRAEIVCEVWLFRVMALTGAVESSFGELSDDSSWCVDCVSHGVKVMGCNWTAVVIRGRCLLAVADCASSSVLCV